MRIGSLFSGIGGLELGLERAGLGRTVYQVERDAYCRHVLARHWPDVPRFDDVRTVGARNLPPVDVVCGGFPCQDLSAAGKQAGLAGARSGLWFEMRRIVDEQRPTWVVVENVAHTWARYVPVVRRALWELGYASLPLRVRACDVGARHERERILLVAGPPADVDGIGRRTRAEGGVAALPEVRAAAGAAVADAARVELPIGADIGGDGQLEREAASGGAGDRPGWESPGWGLAPARALGGGVHGLPGGVDGPWGRAGWTGARLREARIRGLGNAVVPACAEAVGRLIVDAVRARGAA